jgi:hypothetical protein
MKIINNTKLYVSPEAMVSLTIVPKIKVGRVGETT